MASCRPATANDPDRVTSFEPATEPATEPTTSSIATSTTDATSSTTGSSSATDVFTGPDDLGGHELGCGGKIDLLIVRSRDSLMADVYQAVDDAMEALVEAAGERFAFFDLHAMVVNADAYGWGQDSCVEACEANAGAGCEPVGPADYPCDHKPTVCDETWGAGVVFPAGLDATNEPCAGPVGPRYFDAEGLACAIRLGLIDKTSGQPATAMMRALDDEEGCNAGFLRGHALLVVVLAADDATNGLEGSPEQWFQALALAKGDSPYVLLVLTSDNGQPEASCGSPGDGTWLFPLQEFVLEAEHGVWAPICLPDLTGFVTEAVDLVYDVCEVFVPG